VEKAHPNKVFLKTDFGETEFSVLQQRHPKKKRVPRKLTPAYECEFPISAAKYADLMSKIDDKIIPESYTLFYANLPVSRNVTDCLPDTGDDDDDEADD